MSFDVEAYLRSIERFGMKPGLDRIELLLEKLGSPQRALQAAHVGGTNGKGSVSAMTSRMLLEAGYKVGLYTSPHLARYNERIQVGGEPIGDDDLQALFAEVAEAAAAVKSVHGEAPTEFEVGTAAAFLHFAREQVDVAVVEVGLGGRLDSTNVLQPKAIAISPISLDHTVTLGNSLAAIAREKAGIFRSSARAVIAPQASEAAAVIKAVAADVGTRLWWLEETAGSGTTPAGGVRYAPLEVSRRGNRLDVSTPIRTYRDLQTSLLGPHQIVNAATAVALADALTEAGVPIPESAVRAGAANVRWPGRMQWIPGDPPILLDGVHNPAGARAFAETLERLYPDVPFAMVVGVLAEKEVDGIIHPLLPFASSFVLTRPARSRQPGRDPVSLAERVREKGKEAIVVEPPAKAVDAARDMVKKGGAVCVVGSLYLVGEVLGRLTSDAGQPEEEED